MLVFERNTTVIISVLELYEALYIADDPEQSASK